MAQQSRFPTGPNELARTVSALVLKQAALERQIRRLRSAGQTPTHPRYDPDFPDDPVETQVAFKAGAPYYYIDGAWHAFGSGGGGGGGAFPYVHDVILDADADQVIFDDVPTDPTVIASLELAFRSSHTDAGIVAGLFLMNGDETDYEADYFFSLTPLAPTGAAVQETDAGVLGDGDNGSAFGFIPAYGVTNAGGVGLVKFPNSTTDDGDGIVYSAFGGGTLDGYTPDSWVATGLRQSPGPLTRLVLYALKVEDGSPVQFKAGSRFTLTGFPAAATVDDGGGGGGGAGDREIAVVDEPLSVAGGAGAALPLAHASVGGDDALLDYSTPTAPTFVAGGVYSVVASVNASGMTPGALAQATLDMTSEGAASTDQTPATGAGFWNGTASMIWRAVAGDALQVGVFNLGAAAADFSALVYVQRVA